MTAISNQDSRTSDSSSQPFYYLPDPGLRAAVKVAYDLKMPLLVTGEPGTGKTELARWIAKWIEDPKDLDSSAEPLRFDTKTTSAAKDLFYRYDAIRHFSNKDSNPLDFITFEAMGRAIIEARPKQPRRVVLVDEIDKAPRDFPNDVLFQFENYAFRIEEASKSNVDDYNKVERHSFNLHQDENSNISLPAGAEPPFLLLTSNSEKNLPDAFLRRCVYYHISFPEPSKDANKTLEKIVLHKANVGEGYRKHLAIPANLDALLKYFEEVRNKGLQKKPATAELIKWVEAMGREGHEVFWNKIHLEDPKDPMRALLLDTMPVLVKTREDLEIFQELRSNS